jgi:hypothetical protein
MPRSASKSSTSQAQGEPQIEPDCLVDDFGGKLIFFIHLATEPPARPQERFAVTKPPRPPRSLE